ncbi:MAG: hypothetical protein JNL01_05480 [Bdellovibrionales bacterium]|nr:hypothetical protein [Bdellovibrionales bacterium]
MPRRKFQIQIDGRPEQLAVILGFFNKKATLEMGGVTLGTTENLDQGIEFKLRDGSLLKVQMNTKTWPRDLIILRDGLPVPGSDSHPRTQLKGALAVMILIGSLNVGIGIFTFATGSLRLALAGAGWGTVIFGIAFFVLAVPVGYTYRTGKARVLALIGLSLAILIFLGDAAGTVYLATQGSTTMNPVGWVIMRVVLIVQMCRALPGLIRT